MSTLALLLASVFLAPPEPPIQLVVKEDSTASACGEPRPGWQRREATAAAAAEDLRRYFDGLSFQETPLVNAAWRGEVIFCTPGAEAQVARVLSQLAVSLGPEFPQEGSKLVGGAEDLLTALASEVLAKELEAIEVVGADEEERKAEALALVRSRLSPSTGFEDVVAALDTRAADRVAVHLQGHAAIYYLLRTDSAFEARFDCLRESLATGRRLRFNYRVAGQVLTAVECLEAP